MTCILLTATIKPINTPNVAISDSFIREIQYFEALKYYLTLNIPIVFCENSNTFSKKIINLVKGKENFEYLSFQSVQSIKGKSHGENEIIDYAYKHSKIIGQSQYVIKISGRYIVKNINTLILFYENNPAYILANFSHNLMWCDSKLMFYKKEFYYKYLQPMLDLKLDDKNKICFEKVLALSVHKCIADGYEYKPWKYYPYYEGICGGSGKNYSFHLFRKIKYNMYFILKNWIYKQHI